MASGSAGAAHFAGTAPILPSLLAVPPPEPTLTYLLPMLGSLAAALAGVEANVAPCVEIRDVMERSVTPLLRVTSLPGLALLALGAGYGEEALFRGFLIPVASASALNSGVDGGVATALALGSSSVVFGALHAVTPLYFAWATAAGALFGMCLAAAVAPMLSGADHVCLLPRRMGVPGNRGRAERMRSHARAVRFDCLRRHRAHVGGATRSRGT